jgi:DNA polymerase-3 subunit delta
LIYLLYGDDDFTIEEALVSLRSEVGLPDVRDVNTTAFDASVSRAEMMATCDTVPFLADKRLVIVRGLLTRFERPRPPRSRSKSDSATAGLGEWKGLSEYLEHVPETTDLVFVDGALAASNQLLKAVQPHANSRLFLRPNPADLRQWIRTRVASLGADIEPNAVDELAKTIGSDLRVVAGELEKLALYRSGAPIRREDVLEMVSYTRDANIFTTVDAVLEGHSALAARMVHLILGSGESPGYLLAMLSRQVRLLILAKDLDARRVPAPERGKRLGLSGYPLRKTMEQERKFRPEQLVMVHRRLMEADLRIKSSSLDKSVALDLLVAEVAAIQHVGS